MSRKKQEKEIRLVMNDNNIIEGEEENLDSSEEGKISSPKKGDQGTPSKKTTEGIILPKTDRTNESKKYKEPIIPNIIDDIQVPLTERKNIDSLDILINIRKETKKIPGSMKQITKTKVTSKIQYSGSSNEDENYSGSKQVKYAKGISKLKTSFQSNSDNKLVIDLFGKKDKVLKDSITKSITIIKNALIKKYKNIFFKKILNIKNLKIKEENNSFFEIALTKKDINKLINLFDSNKFNELKNINDKIENSYVNLKLTENDKNIINPSDSFKHLNEINDINKDIKKFGRKISLTLNDNKKISNNVNYNEINLINEEIKKGEFEIHLTKNDNAKINTLTNKTKFNEIEEIDNIINNNFEIRLTKNDNAKINTLTNKTKFKEIEEINKIVGINFEIKLTKNDNKHIAPNKTKFDEIEEIDNFINNNFEIQLTKNDNAKINSLTNKTKFNEIEEINKILGNNFEIKATEIDNKDIAPNKTKFGEIEKINKSIELNNEKNMHTINLTKVYNKKIIPINKSANNKEVEKINILQNECNINLTKTDNAKVSNFKKEDFSELNKINTEKNSTNTYFISKTDIDDKKICILKKNNFDEIAKINEFAKLNKTHNLKVMQPNIIRTGSNISFGQNDNDNEIIITKIKTTAAAKPMKKKQSFLMNTEEPFEKDLNTDELTKMIEKEEKMNNNQETNVFNTDILKDHNDTIQKDLFPQKSENQTFSFFTQFANKTKNNINSIYGNNNGNSLFDSNPFGSNLKFFDNVTSINIKSDLFANQDKDKEDNSPYNLGKKDNNFNGKTCIINDCSGSFTPQIPRKKYQDSQETEKIEFIQNDNNNNNKDSKDSNNNLSSSEKIIFIDPTSKSNISDFNINSYSLPQNKDIKEFHSNINNNNINNEIDKAISLEKCTKFNNSNNNKNSENNENSENNFKKEKIEVCSSNKNSNIEYKDSKNKNTITNDKIIIKENEDSINKIDSKLKNKKDSIKTEKSKEEKSELIINEKEGINPIDNKITRKSYELFINKLNDNLELIKNDKINNIEIKEVKFKKEEFIQLFRAKLKILEESIKYLKNIYFTYFVKKKNINNKEEIIKLKKQFDIPFYRNKVREAYRELINLIINNFKKYQNKELKNKKIEKIQNLIKKYNTLENEEFRKYLNISEKRDSQNLKQENQKNIDKNKKEDDGLISKTVKYILPIVLFFVYLKSQVTTPNL